MKILHVFTLAVTAEAFFNGQFRYFSDRGHDVWMSAATVPSEAFVSDNKVTFHRLDIRRRISPFADLRTIVKLVRLIRREKFDIIIGHTPKGAMVAMFAARLAGHKRRVYYRHGLVYTTARGLKRFILKTVEKATAMCATHIINVSPSLGKLAVKDRLNSAGKQFLIGRGTCGGIDTIRMFNPDYVSAEMVSDIRHSLGMAEEGFVVGYCGRLCRDKGIIELIEGVNLFKKEHPTINVYLLLIGPYDERDILPANIIDKIKHNREIFAPGEVGHEDLAAYYALMHVFVFPSYREGFGMTVIEASAMRRPVLVSRAHGCVDTICENVTGFYIDLTPKSIAASLGKMLNSVERDRLGEGGREYVVRHFEQSVLWPQIHELYKSIIGQ